MRPATSALLFAAITLSALLGCGSGPAVTSSDSSPDSAPAARLVAVAAADVVVARSPKPRDGAPQASKADQEVARQGLERFSLDLYRQLSSKPGNLCLSPYSLRQTMAMVYAGARGETADEIDRTCHFSLPPERLHPALSAIELALTAPEQTYRLVTANSLWVQAGLPFQPAFLEDLAVHYGADARLVDFKKNTEGARVAINDWARERTDQKIPELLSPDVLTKDFRVVVANAVSFKAEWRIPFEASLTKPQPFKRLDETTVDVPMMHAREMLLYHKTPEFQVVELRYKHRTDLTAAEEREERRRQFPNRPIPQRGPGLSMLLVLPAPGAFATFEKDFSEARLADILAADRLADVQLTLPKFKFANELDLRESLPKMGMPLAFSDTADFSGTTTAEKLCLGCVVQKTLIALDEKGTEAAVATAAGEQTMSLPVFLAFDRPFLFIIHDYPTGTILFLGRVMDPSRG